MYPVIEAENDVNNQDHTGKNVNDFIETLGSIDFQGDFFRYPTEFNHQYHKLSNAIDPINVLKCIRAVTNVLEGCDAMFDHFADDEAEMYTEN